MLFISLLVGFIAFFRKSSISYKSSIQNNLGNMDSSCIMNDLVHMNDSGKEGMDLRVISEQESQDEKDQENIWKRMVERFRKFQMMKYLQDENVSQLEKSRVLEENPEVYGYREYGNEIFKYLDW